MVKFLFIIFLLFLVDNGYAQRDTSIHKMGYIFEIGPLFKGGEEALREFVEESIIYPLSAIKDSIEGKVYVSYTIDTLGFTREHYIEKGIRNDLNKEALRVTQLIKYEKPAMLKGKPMLFHETIPIKFKLSNDSMMITYIGEPPLFSGNLKDFIRKQIRYPEEEQKDSLEGTVFISFWIDTLGFTTDHQVIRGVRKDLDKEALRVAKLIRFKKPAMQLGKPIKVPFTIPVDFKLSNCSENESKKKARIK